MIKIGYMLSNIIFVSKVEWYVILYPAVPFFFLSVMTAILICLTLTITMTNITSIVPIFAAACVIGAADGSMFAAFLFHAVSKLDIPNKTGHLHFRERELVVNLLMISQNLGKFFGMLAAHLYFIKTNPELVFHQPK